MTQHHTFLKTERRERELNKQRVMQLDQQTSAEDEEASMEALMNLVSRTGRWLDEHCPDV